MLNQIPFSLAIDLRWLMLWPSRLSAAFLDSVFRPMKTQFSGNDKSMAPAFLASLAKHSISLRFLFLSSCELIWATANTVFMVAPVFYFNIILYFKYKLATLEVV